MIEQIPGSRSRFGGWCLVVAAVLAGLMPLRMLAQERAAVETGAAEGVSGGAGVNGATPPTPPTPRSPRPPQPAVAAEPPASPVPAAPPELPAPRKDVGYFSKNSGDSAWVLLYGEDAATMNGSAADLSAARSYRSSSKEEILWFHHGDRAYVIRDPATLQQAKEIFEGEAQLRAQQSDLGGQQSALGARQMALGNRQTRLGSERSALAEERRGRGTADAQDLTRRAQEIEAQLDQIGHEQDEIAERQNAVQRQQEALGRTQEEENRRAEAELRSLMGRAIESGLAQEVR